MPSKIVVGEGTRNAARAVVALAAAEVAGKAATFAIMVLAARRLGSNGFGAFAFALAIALLVATAVTWGFDTLVTRRGSRDPSSLADAFADLVMLRLGLTVVTLAVTVGVVLVTGSGGAALLLLILSTLLDTIGDAGRAVAAAIGRQSRVAAVLVVQRIATAAVGITALVLGWGVEGLASGFVVGSFLGAIGIVRVVHGLGIPLSLRRAQLGRMTVMLRESMAVGINAVVSTALFRLDSVLLGLLAGNLAVGRYAAAYRLLETVMFVNWAVAKAVFPSMAAARAAWQVRRGLERGVTVCAFLFAPYSVLLLWRGGQLMRLLFGPAYAGRGGVVLAWLAMAPLAFGIAFLAAYALYALDRSKAVLIGSISALVVNTVANLVFIPVGGDIAAAITTTGSYMVEAVVLCALLARDIGRPHLGRPLLLPVVAVVPGALLLMTSLPLVVAAALEIALYLVLWWGLSSRFDPEGIAVLRALLPVRRAAA